VSAAPIQPSHGVTEAVVGIDPSTTRIGWAIVALPDGSLIGSGSISLPKSRGALTRVWVGKTLLGSVLRSRLVWPPAFVAVEEPMPVHAGRGGRGDGARGVIAIAAAWGALAAEALDCRCGLLNGDDWAQVHAVARSQEERLIVLNNQTVKRLATGNGAAPKAMVQAAMERLYGRAFETHDEADAVAVAVAGAQLAQERRVIAEQAVTADGKRLDERTRKRLITAAGKRGGSRRRGGTR